MTLPEYSSHDLMELIKALEARVALLEQEVFNLRWNR